jgi:two-component system LytT family response regulator
MINTLIIDDEQHSINAIENLLKNKSGYRICETAKTVENAIELTRTLKPDLVFLDIVLGKKTGFDFLNAFLPKINFDVIFTTAYNAYAVKAFEYSALHYLLKPIDKEEFDTALSRMENKISQQEHLERLLSFEYNFGHPDGYKFIHLSTLNNYYKINSKEILYVESDSNYSNFYLINGRKITTSKTLKYYTQILSESHFYKVSKSYMVNIEQIKTYKKKSRELIMSNDFIISVAIRRQKDFVKAVFSNQGE